MAESGSATPEVVMASQLQRNWYHGKLRDRGVFRGGLRAGLADVEDSDGEIFCQMGDSEWSEYNLYRHQIRSDPVS